MNYLPPAHAQALADAEPILTIEHAHEWRSKIVDKCAEAERHVLRLLRAGRGTWSAKAPLSQKMECLRNLIAEGGGVIRAPKVRPLLDRLEPISNFRSELVHSTLSIAVIEGEWAAILWNAAEAQPADGCRSILTFGRLKDCHTELSKIVNSLDQEAGIAEKQAGPPLSRG